MKRPVTVTIAVVLVWITAVFDALAALGFLGVAAAASIPEGEAAIAKSLAEGGISDIPAGMIGTTFLVLAILFLAIAVVEIVVAIFLGRGANWARVVITVFIGLGFVSSLVDIIQGGWGIITGGIGIVLKIVVLWLLWNARSSEWIREKSLQRIQ